MLSETCSKSPSGKHEYNKFGICIWCGKAKSYDLALSKAEAWCRGIISPVAKEECMRKKVEKLGWSYEGGGRRFGKPRTEEEREKRHRELYGETAPAERGRRFQGETVELPSPPEKELRVPWLMEKEEALKFIGKHPCMDGVWKTLELDRTLIPSAKNALWQDFVAAWNRRGILTNEEAELLIKARFTVE